MYTWHHGTARCVFYDDTRCSSSGAWLMETIVAVSADPGELENNCSQAITLGSSGVPVSVVHMSLSNQPVQVQAVIQPTQASVIQTAGSQNLQTIQVGSWLCCSRTRPSARYPNEQAYRRTAVYSFSVWIVYYTRREVVHVHDLSLRAWLSVFCTTCSMKSVLKR